MSKDPKKSSAPAAAGDKKAADPKAAKGGDKKAEKEPAKEEKKKEEPKKAAPAPAPAAKPAAAKPAAPAAGGAAHADGGAPAAGVPFRRFFYRGIEVVKLLDLTPAELVKLFHARARRRFKRGHIGDKLLKRLRKAKKDAVGEERPKTIKTHLRDYIILPEMVGSIVGVYNGLGFTQVEVKPDMIGHYLGEFSITYKPVSHGKSGTGGAKVVPLK